MRSYLEPLMQPESVVVLVGPRLRCSVADYHMLEHFVGTLPECTTFRVSGMISGPEIFVEDIAPALGHRVEVYGPDGRTPEGRARRLNKHDERERDASMLLGASALWLWVLPSDLHHRGDRVLNDPMVLLAQELEVPVFLFLPESSDFEVLELT